MGNFDMLPFEIVLDILSRVPDESILECKLVSKPWRNLLQHPSFSQMHLNHLNHLDSAHDSDGKMSFIFYTEGSYLEKPFYYSEYDEDSNRFIRITRINLRLPFKNCYILSSINGLVCFKARYNDEHFFYEPAYICNPITREYVILPKYEGDAFLLSGFGYSPSTNEYKVVRICASRKDPNYGIVQVYTLGSGIGWRNSRKMDYDDKLSKPYGTYVDGVIHWVDYKGSILAFDLADEEFRELPPPSAAGNQHPIAILQHGFGNSLCASYCNGGSSDIWVLKKNKYNHDVIWSKEFSNLKMSGKLITFTRSGGLLCYDYCYRNVYWYSPKASFSRTLVNLGKSINNGVPHKNTLVSLKALGEKDMKLMDSGEQDPAGRQKPVGIGQWNLRRKNIHK